MNESTGICRKCSRARKYKKHFFAIVPRRNNERGLDSPLLRFLHDLRLPVYSALGNNWTITHTRASRGPCFQLIIGAVPFWTSTAPAQYLSYHLFRIFFSDADPNVLHLDPDPETEFWPKLDPDPCLCNTLWGEFFKKNKCRINQFFF